MADLPSRFHDALKGWADAAMALGWFDADAARRLDEAAMPTPGALFDSAERPLVAGLFGGTGVGKSSLLNRIAGREIARASAERPTSRGISAYVHESVRIDRLPDDFPMARLATAVHREPRWRDVLWIDMPDFDSVEASHAELVRQWLPHIDVVLYVVSPERYRDDRGWRLLLEHGAEHAWAFVMNHWDRADARQLDDFRRVLDEAGFDAPRIFRTCAAPASTDRAADARREDDFDALVALLEGLADAQTIRDLEARGVLQRLGRLDAAAADLAARGGDEAALEDLRERWLARWGEASDGIRGSVRARLPALTGDGGAAGGLAAPPERDPRDACAAVLDESTLDRIDETARRFFGDAVSARLLPPKVAGRALEADRDALPGRLAETLDAAVGRSMATPGSAFRRALHRTLVALAVLLPLAALGWIATRVLAAFAAGGDDPARYLGTDFAINAGLLALLAWALPWFLARRSKPSSAQALRRGLEVGLDQALELVGERHARALGDIVDERRALDFRLAEAREGFGLPRRGDAEAASDAGDGELPEALRRLVRARLPVAASAAGGAGSAHAASSGAGAANDPAGDGADDAAVRASTHSSTDATPVS